MAYDDPIGLAFQEVTKQICVAIAETTGRFAELAGKNFQRMSLLFQDAVENRAAIVQLNQDVANAGQEAMLDAYIANVLDERIAPPYREGENRLPGALGRILGNRSMAVGTVDGIEFFNQDLANAQAAHWARLNFGAGPGEGYSGSAAPAESARIQFGSNQGLSLSLEDGPRPNFNVPGIGFKGFFNDVGQFFILHGNEEGTARLPEEGARVVKGKPSRSGIAPRRFIDAGVVAIAETIGPTYQEYFDSIPPKVLAELGY